MAALTIDDVYKIARLSKLKLTTGQAEHYRKELESILGYIEQLKEVPTDHVAPTAQVTGLKNVTRKDEPADYGVGKEGLLSNAPQHEDGYFKVKRVL